MFCCPRIISTVSATFRMMLVLMGMLMIVVDMVVAMMTEDVDNYGDDAGWCP